jgi:hypothetical protein
LPTYAQPSTDAASLATIVTTPLIDEGVRHMESAARVLVVANKTAATPALLDAVRERAARGPCAFTLLVPNPAHGLHSVVDPEDQSKSEAETTIELALPLLEEAAGGPVDSMIGVPFPLDAVQDAVNLHGFDEIIISTLPTRVSKWLHLDLPSKVAALGLPVTTVTARSREGANAG